MRHPLVLNPDCALSIAYCKLDSIPFRLVITYYALRITNWNEQSPSKYPLQWGLSAASGAFAFGDGSLYFEGSGGFQYWYLFLLFYSFPYSYLVIQSQITIFALKIQVEKTFHNKAISRRFLRPAYSVGLFLPNTPASKKISMRKNLWKVIKITVAITMISYKKSSCYR